MLPCQHRSSEPTSQIGCPGCGGMVTLVYGCAVHGECTTGTIEPGIKWCWDCAERELEPLKTRSQTE